MARNPVSHNRTKHIDIQHHYVREAVRDNVIVLKHCSSKEMIADILTKPLHRGQFTYLRDMMGLGYVNRNDN